MKIFGISGRAQSGKSTLAEYIAAQENWVDIDEDSNAIPVTNVFIKSFADELKRICRDLFNIPEYNLYDDEGKKEKLAHLRWENIPGVVCPRLADEINNELMGDFPYWPCNHSEFIYHDPGPMTAREFLETFGTFICRSIYPNCWINSILNANYISHDILVIPDVRVKNEVEAIKKAGGYVLRLTRNPENRNTPIEVDLDQGNYDWGGFDAILDNEDMDLEEKNRRGYEIFNTFMGSS